MPDESTIPAELLAKWAGITEAELYEALRGTLKPEDGKYPATKAIKLTFEYLREQLDFITGKELAELQEVSQPRVSNQVKDGIISQDGKGRYPRRATLHALLKYWRNRVGEGKTTAASAKNVSIQLDNELRQIALDKAKGNALPRASVEKAVTNIILLARQTWLQMIPKMEQMFPMFPDGQAAAKWLEEWVERGLGELSQPVEFETEAETEATDAD